jgi:hypothetical protein
MPLVVVHVDSFMFAIMITLGSVPVTTVTANHSIYHCSGPIGFVPDPSTLPQPSKISFENFFTVERGLQVRPLSLKRPTTH